MERLSVVLYQNDPGIAEALAAGLSRHIESVYVADSPKELGDAIERNRAQALVLDLEDVDLGEMERLHHRFPSLCIVGIHRLADDKLWAEAMSLGASDICEPRPEDVARSVLQGLMQRAAA